MKNKNLIRRITAGFTAFAASVACTTTTSMIAPVSELTAVAADDTDNYAKLLQYSMYLYDGNMCGGDVDKKSGFSIRFSFPIQHFIIDFSFEHICISYKIVSFILSY